MDLRKKLSIPGQLFLSAAVTIGLQRTYVRWYVGCCQVSVEGPVIQANGRTDFGVGSRTETKLAAGS